jgi:amino-acid N-acetyltransferase
MGFSVDQQIISLNASHLSDIETLLQKCELPFGDCNKHLENFFGIISGERLIAIGALQIKGSVALLRSIAVPRENRGRGLAALMTQHLLGMARSKHVRELYLLTETAELYFAKFGFCLVKRDTVPDAIKATHQFETLCPASAQAMRLYL